MYASLINAIVIAVGVIGAAGAACYWLIAERRRRGRRAEWEAMQDALLALDSELDQVWAREGRRHGHGPSRARRPGPGQHGFGGQWPGR